VSCAEVCPSARNFFTPLHGTFFAAAMPNAIERATLCRFGAVICLTSPAASVGGAVVGASDRRLGAACAGGSEHDARAQPWFQRLSSYLETGIACHRRGLHRRTCRALPSCTRETYDREKTPSTRARPGFRFTRSGRTCSAVLRHVRCKTSWHPAHTWCILRGIAQRRRRASQDN
jgi:hypothetical protein